jgi:hypothetical protein
MSMLSLFRAVTLEDWTDLMYIAMYGSEAYGYDAGMLAEWQPTSKAMPVVGAGYFVSFVLMGTKEAKEAELTRLRDGGEPTVQDDLATLEAQLDAFNDTVARVKKRVRSQGKAAQRLPNSVGAELGMAMSPRWCHRLAHQLAGDPIGPGAQGLGAVPAIARS